MPEWLDTIGRGAASVGRFGANTLAIVAGSPVLPFPAPPSTEWRFPERQKLAQQYVPSTLPPEEQAKRMETFRQVPLDEWPALIGQFAKQDKVIADTYADPHYQATLAADPQQAMQRFPNIPLPPEVLAARDMPLSPESRAAGLSAPSQPFPVASYALPLPHPEKRMAYRTAQDQLAFTENDERAARTVAKVGLTPEMEAESARLTAAGTRAGQEPFDIAAEQRASGTRLREKQAASDIDEARAGREALLPTPAARSQAQMVLNESTGLTELADSFLANLKPENVGFVAKLRKAAFGASAQTDAFSKTLAPSRDAVLDDIAANNLQPGTEPGVDVTKYFDPTLSTIEMLGNVIAYRHAKILDPTGKLSDADIENSKKSLGLGGMLVSDADVRKRIELVKEFSGKSAAQAQKVLAAKPAGTKAAAPAGPLDLGDGFSLRFK
jgi:hypothetical protein